MSAAVLRPVAVIGAGLSGLSCAHALLQAGHTVHLFDKSRGPSGRMSTRRAEDAHGPWQCDHGAQYFTARDAAFRAEVARWQQADVADLWDARLASFDGSAFAPLHTPLERFVGTPRMTSPAAWLVQNLGERAGASARTQWQTTVQRLDRHTDGWAITSAEQGLHPEQYGAVVLAVPAPQAAPLLAPVSPAGAAVAASAPMRGSWAVVLRYAAPLAMPWEGVFINTGPETWLLHASPEWSDAHLEDSAESVAAALLAAFAALGGPAPLAATAHRWRYADTEPALTQGSGWSASLRLGLCGDWLNGGKVEGAWLSGRALAAQILRC